MLALHGAAQLVHEVPLVRLGLVLGSACACLHLLALVKPWTLSPSSSASVLCLADPSFPGSQALLLALILVPMMSLEAK